MNSDLKAKLTEMEVDSSIAIVFRCFEDFLRKAGTMNVFETLVYNYRLKEEFLHQVRIEDFSSILHELVQNLTILCNEMGKVKSIVPEQQQNGTEFHVRQVAAENNFINMITLDNSTYLPVIEAEDLKSVGVVVTGDLQTLFSVKLDPSAASQQQQQQNGMVQVQVQQQQTPQNVELVKPENGVENSELFMIPILKEEKSEEELSVGNICSMLGTEPVHAVEEPAAAAAAPPVKVAEKPKLKKKKVYKSTTASQPMAAAATTALNDDELMFFCCDKCFHSFRTEERFSAHKCAAKGGANGKNSNLIKDNSGLRKMKKFVCGLCLEEYRNLDRISFHLKRCEGGPFPCEMCPNSAPQFSTMKSLNFHKIHEHKEERSFICKDCGFPFKFKCSLQKHKLRAHNTELQPRTFPCDLCPSVFLKKIFLTNHKVKSHSAERADDSSSTAQFPCTDCDRTFPRKEQLSLHSAIHSGTVKPHPCSTCGKTFSKKSKLDDHARRRHSTVKESFNCGSCAKVFRTRKDQRQHERRMHRGKEEAVAKKEEKGRKESAELHEGSSSSAQGAAGGTSLVNNHSAANSEGSSSQSGGTAVGDESTQQLMSDFMEALTPGQLEQIIQADFLVPTLIP